MTGAASGIGRAVVTAFLREGADVIAADVTYPSPSPEGDPREQVVRLDISQEDDWERLSERLRHLDVLVACAGISAAKPISETSLKDWCSVMEVNLDGTFLSVKYGARLMHESGGAIVVVGSVSGVKASAGASAYCVSKAAVRMLVKTAALELKPQAIRVNCVSPGGVATPMWQKMPFWQELVEKHGGEEGAWNALGGIDPAKSSIQRMAFPEEIASTIVFLSCDESTHITGANIIVDGGHSL
ncbi:MAG: SDR family oxidoreductase [Candidatus Korobacteraceae bacterium]